jgi:hypothetical protein
LELVFEDELLLVFEELLELVFEDELLLVFEELFELVFEDELLARMIWPVVAVTALSPISGTARGAASAADVLSPSARAPAPMR